MGNDFDLIAPVYDPLASLFSLGAIAASQRIHLPLLLHAERVLIVGGGAGRFLVELLRAARAVGVQPRVLYLELSRRMLDRARRTLARELPDAIDEVEFRHGSELALRSEDGLFDALVTNFFFDLFPDARAREVGQILSVHLGATGRWLVVDWQRPVAGLARAYASLVFPLMYGFFRIVSQLEASQPPDYGALFHSLNMVPHAQGSAYLGLIRATLFVRSAPPTCPRKV